VKELPLPLTQSADHSTYKVSRVLYDRRSRHSLRVSEAGLYPHSRGLDRLSR
jgi:hypothetical protein